jgi:hypothetical protein
MDLTEDAYKPIEKRMINYLVVYHVLERILSEQRVHGVFHDKANKAYLELKSQLQSTIQAYSSLPEVLPVPQLQLDIYSEGDGILSGLDLNDPLQPEDVVNPKLDKLFSELRKVFITKLARAQSKELPLVLTETEKL